MLTATVAGPTESCFSQEAGLCSWNLNGRERNLGLCKYMYIKNFVKWGTQLSSLMIQIRLIY